MENNTVKQHKTYTAEQVFEQFTEYGIYFDDKDLPDLLNSAIKNKMLINSLFDNYENHHVDVDLTPKDLKQLYLYVVEESKTEKDVIYKSIYPFTVDEAKGSVTVDKSRVMSVEDFRAKQFNAEKYKMMFELDPKKPDDVLDYVDTLNSLIRNGSARIRKEDGSYQQLESLSEVNFSELNKISVREKEDGPWKNLNQKDITDHLAAGAGVKAPAKPNSWGPFQFIKGIANAVKKGITGKGLKEYEDYDKAKKEYELRKYVEMKANHYSYNEPANVAAEAKKMAVDAYAQMAYEGLVDKVNEDYPGKQNPLENPDVQDRFRETLLAAPQADQLIEHAGVTEYLRTLLADGQTELGQDKSFKKAVDDVMGDDVIQPFVNTAIKPLKKEKMQQMRSTIAEKTAENIQNTLKIGGTEKDQQFLDAMKEIMEKGTPQEEGIRHLLQSAVALNDTQFLNRVRGEFLVNGKESVTNSLKCLVDVSMKGCAETFADWGIHSMSKELKDKLYVTQNTVEAKLDKGMANAYKPGELNDLETDYKNLQSSQKSI